MTNAYTGTMAKKLDMDDLARMVLEGFKDIGERMATKDDFKLLVEELNATHAVPEWDNLPVRFALEEDAAMMPGGKWDWVDGRQTEFYLIKP